MSRKQNKERAEKHLEYIEGLKDEHIVKILDTMPGNAEEIKVLLQGYVVSVGQEDMKKIATIVAEYKK